jgi:hypothetical protein
MGGLFTRLFSAFLVFKSEQKTARERNYKMNTQSTHKPILVIVLFITAIALTSLACSFNPVRISPIHISPISPTIDITLPQDLFDRASQKADFHADGTFENLLDRITRVELHDGYIRFIGENDRVQGSVDLSITAEDGALKAEVIAIDIPGLALGDEVVTAANQELEEAFTDMVEDSNGKVIFKEVSVVEGGLRLKIQVNIDEITIPEMQIEIN